MSIETVLGPLEPEAITRILPHEHLLSLTPGPWLIGGSSSPALEDEHKINLAVELLRTLEASGFNTVFDLSPYGVVGRDEKGANVALLAEISKRSNVHIVLGSAVYLERFSPSWLRNLSRQELSKLFVRDLTEGMGGTSIRAAVLGEQATGLDEISEFERRCMQAACDAHKETGAPIFTHTTHGSMALEQLEIFGAEGIPFSQVVIGHMDIQPNALYTKQVLESGASVAFDTIGKQFWEFFLQPKNTPDTEGEFSARYYFRSDESRLDALEQLIRGGFVNQILLSQDLTGAEAYMNPSTHGTWGVNYLAASFLPRLKQRDVSEAEIDVMTRINPLRLLGES